MSDIVAVRRVRLRRKYRKLKLESVFRDRSDPFNIPEEIFKNKFCLTRMAVKDLCAELKPYLMSRSTVYSAELQVLSCLQVLRCSSFQGDVCSSDFAQISQATMSRNMNRFLTAILHILPQYISFPATAKEIEEVKDDFHSLTSFSGLIGCLDCFYVNISKPPDEYCDTFLNNKNEYSLNVQLVCDSKMKILDVVARWPGSCDDDVIWKNSAVRTMFESGHIPKKNFLLGDHAYQIEPWLLTPYPKALTPEQKKFNAFHKGALNIIKRCFHLLKTRFRCLHEAEAKLQYIPDKVCKIILSCCILHNICLKYNIEYDSELLCDKNNDTFKTEFSIPHECDLELLKDETSDTDEPDEFDISLEHNKLINQAYLLRNEIASKL